MAAKQYESVREAWFMKSWFWALGDMSGEIYRGGVEEGGSRVREGGRVLRVFENSESKIDKDWFLGERYWHLGLLFL